MLRRLTVKARSRCIARICSKRRNSNARHTLLDVLVQAAAKINRPEACMAFACVAKPAGAENMALIVPWPILWRQAF